MSIEAGGWWKRSPYNVHLLGSFRYDNFSNDSVTENLVPAAPTTQTSAPEDKVTPRFGLLWRALPELSIYANYMESFGTANFNSLTGTVLPPESAQQKEVGIKTELFGKRLTGSVAWFDITKQNVAAPDPNPAQVALGCQTAIGEVRNQGLEVDVSGEILPGWKLIAAYSYIDSEITKDRGLASIIRTRTAIPPSPPATRGSAYLVRLSTVAVPSRPMNFSKATCAAALTVTGVEAHLPPHRGQLVWDRGPMLASIRSSHD